jgi:hypothetical protein
MRRAVSTIDALSRLRYILMIDGIRLLEDRTRPVELGVLMKLTDLHPQFIGAGGPGIYNADMTPATPRTGIGLMFDCPKCPAYPAEHEDERHERHFIQFANPLDGGPPFEANRPMWTRVGDTFETLQLSPSILSDPAKGGCGWHGYIGLTIPGEVTTC